MARFSGQTVVVTGAARGIGAGVAEHFAQHGAYVIGVDLRDGIVEKFDTLPGHGHLGIVADLTTHEDIAKVTAQVLNSGTPQVLVNSAGVGLTSPGADLTPELWEKTMAVNLTAAFFMAQAVGTHMLEAGYGRIINIASQAAELGLEQHAAYSASKAGMLGFTRVLAVEWGKHGVTVNAVSPTVVGTEMALSHWAGERGEAARAEIPTGRFAQVDEVAELVGYLAGPQAGMLNGANLPIDGGRSVI